jgi:hypothetical protein
VHVIPDFLKLLDQICSIDKVGIVTEVVQVANRFGELASCPGFVAALEMV